MDAHLDHNKPFPADVDHDAPEVKRAMYQRQIDRIDEGNRRAKAEYDRKVAEAAAAKAVFEADVAKVRLVRAVPKVGVVVNYDPPKSAEYCTVVVRPHEGFDRPVLNDRGILDFTGTRYNNLRTPKDCAVLYRDLWTRSDIVDVAVVAYPGERVSTPLVCDFAKGGVVERKPPPRDDKGKFVAGPAPVIETKVAEPKTRKERRRAKRLARRNNRRRSRK